MPHAFPTAPPGIFMFDGNKPAAHGYGVNEDDVAGLLAYYPIWAGAGSKTQSIVGDGRLDGTISGSKWDDADFGPVLDHVANDEFVDLDVINGVIDTTKGTLEMLVRLRAMVGSGIVFDSRRVANSHQVSVVWIDGDTELRFLYFGGTVDEIRSTRVQDDGEWHHIAMTWDTVASEFKAYTDGVIENTVGITAAITGPIDQSSLGGVSGGGDSFDGQFGLCKLYDRVLTADEILDHAEQSFRSITPGTQQITPVLTARRKVNQSLAHTTPLLGGLVG